MTVSHQITQLSTRTFENLHTEFRFVTNNKFLSFIIARNEITPTLKCSCSAI